MKTKRKNPAAVALGRKGGRAGTEAQNAARRANGKRGGRPKVKKAVLGKPNAEVGDDRERKI